MASNSQDPETPEEEECGWCKFMKAGPCRKVFEGWQACVDGVKQHVDKTAEDNTGKMVAERCADMTMPLFECMAKNRFYYGSQLDGMAARGKQDHKKQQQQSPTEQQQQQESSSKQSSKEGVQEPPTLPSSSHSTSSSSQPLAPAVHEVAAPTPSPLPAAAAQPATTQHLTTAAV